MSRVAKSPILIPDNVKLAIENGKVIVEGPKGKDELIINKDISIIHEDNSITIKYDENISSHTAIAGTTRSLINNMVVGVEVGFTKSLVVNGVGYRASVGDGILTLQLGYSHDIKLAIPNDLEVKCTKPTEISISGIDKQKVGQFASEVRALRKPEPYKGKGVRYSDEVIRRKEGKKK